MTLGTFCWPISTSGGVWCRSIMTVLAITLISLSSATIEAQQPSPSLEETSKWLKQAFIDYGRVTSPGVNSVVSSIDITSCRVTLTVTDSLNGQAYFTQQDQFSLENLDPGAIETDRKSISDRFWTIVVLHTTNAAPQVEETVSDSNGPKSTTANSIQWIMHFEDPFTSRFVTALKHAIVLCGGKSSIF